MRGREYLVEGHVQGVGFRAFVRHAAVQRGLSGWVRNLADGRVQAQVSGTEEELAAFDQVLRRGPSGSRIEAVTARPCAPEPWGEFDVRPTAIDPNS
jgi:acylphosphatase